MKQRLLAGLLAVVLVLGLAPAALAAAPAEEEAAQVLAALDIMVGDESGNLNLGATVTRAEFTKLAVAASTSRDAVGDTVSVKPYPDVPQSHWAAPYIKAAVDLGLVQGDLHGNFNPGRSITLAEGVTIVLRLLGYQDSDFTGVWPSGQMAQYRALKLNEGVTAGQDSAMTRRDALYLFYNLMITKNKEGSYYLNVLEPTLSLVNAAGELDRVALINSAMEGPVVAAAGWQSSVPFDAGSATVYRNGAKSSLAAVQNQDVVYWSESMHTLWAYSDKITGTYEAASPSVTSPTSVTVAGKSYTIETTSAAYALSDLGGYQIGDSVTLLLGIQHLRASADMARSIVPDIREVRLPEAIMELLDRVYGFVDAHRDRELLRIGKDGIIDDQERPIFDAIVAELGDLVEAAMAVRYAKQGHLEEGVK